MDDAKKGKAGPKATWKIEPKAWWPELPGKDMPKGWDLTWKPVYDKETKKYRWEGPPKISGKRMCVNCRQVAVRGNQRYCRTCAKSRRRSQTRLAMEKRRSLVSKTPFSPIQAEALTKTVLETATTTQEGAK
jgi:hypothetical protein